MQRLLKRCLDENDPDACCELFLLYYKVAVVPVRSLLLRCGFSEEDVEDVVGETVLDLYGENQRKLRSFRGETRAQLCCWIVKVVTNHARNWLRRAIRDARQHSREHLDEQAAHPANHGGITERELRFVLDDLKTLTKALDAGMRENDFHKLRILAGIDEPDFKVPKRTLRHWKQTLGEQCQRLLQAW